METRTVTVTARGKRPEFQFTYEAPSSKKDAIARFSAMELEAMLQVFDDQETYQRTSAERELDQLVSQFKGALAWMAKNPAIGVTKGIEMLVGSGGYDRLSDEQINEVKAEVETPKERKPRGPNKPKAVPVPAPVPAT